MPSSSKHLLQNLPLVAVIVLVTGCDFDMGPIVPSNGCFMSCSGGWGDPSGYAPQFEPLPTPVAGGLAFTAISAGATHTCGITSTGIWCWGERDVGTATYQTAPAPQTIAGTDGMISITAGHALTCGIRADSRALCWGVNIAGETGTGVSGPIWTPTPVQTTLALASVNIGSIRQYGPTHACALTPAGAAYCWGDNYLGQLGNGTQQPSLVPVPVSGAHVFESISVGTQFTCGIVRAGGAYCWGQASDGQQGDDPRNAGNCATPGSGATLSCNRTPRPVTGSVKFTSITAGNAFACGLDTEGRAYCWGANLFGQLGDGASLWRFAPTRVAGSTRFTAIDAGGSSTCALTTDRDVMCWGYNGLGQLGDGTTILRYHPEKVVSTAAFTAITVGDDHACALSTSGAAYCWGSNDTKKLGKGS